ncbi:MAG: GNAT family N-acetyltransferase [Alphaproteobacteria bacterium]|nr:GNAT family N-acetyltransferase [Alphaproteobacteria bacterium]MCB9931479.1 GNAT family N-acetyltransferase [Alphaproteobacteria bacterium]
MTTAFFRTGTPSDLATMINWAADEGWNPGLDDANPFFASDPDGFFVAEMDNRSVASISVVNHNADFAFLGFYICHPDYRGQGIGMGLWTHAMAHAGNRTVGLDGVADQEANYAKSGFVRTGASMRMAGSLSPQDDARVRRMQDGDLDRLLMLDAKANGFSRPGFLTSWLAETQSRRSVVLGDADDITGFATLRRCREGVKIGPIVAPTAEDALCLVRAGLALLPADPVIIDVPSENSAFLSALQARGFNDTFATARMYRGAPPQRSSLLQAIATMELG